MIPDSPGVVRSRSDSSDSLSSFNRLLGEKRNAPDRSMSSVDTLELQLCSLCGSMEDVIASLFSSPVDSFHNDESRTDAEASSGTPVKSTPAPEMKRSPMTAKEVCKLWRTKRKQLKKATVLRQTTSDFELQSATNHHAQRIQRSYERKFDDNDHSQRYEKYGSRADFLRERMS